MHSGPIEVSIAGPEDRADLIRFFRALEAAEHPEDPGAADRGEAGLGRSLEQFDFLRSESCWVLLARVGGEPAGCLLAVRVPKADARAGFLFVDELQVLPAFRRQGVARSLLERVQGLAGELGLAGVRLLVRPENQAGRALYRRCGFEEAETLFCQWRLDRA